MYKIQAMSHKKHFIPIGNEKCIYKKNKHTLSMKFLNNKYSI